MNDTTDPRPVIRLVYAGRRFDGKAKLAHAWVRFDDLDKVLIYSKLRGHAIGGIYTVEQADADGTLYGSTLAFTGERLGDGVEDDAPHLARRAEWSLKDQETLRQDGRRKAEAALARRSDLDEALEPLLAYTATLRTRHDIYALSALVGERLVDAFYTRGKGKRR